MASMSRAVLFVLLAGTLIGAALAPLGSTSIAVAIPLIAESIGESPALVTRLLVGAYLFVCIAGQVPGGKLTDALGTTFALYLGLALFFAGSILGFLVHDLVALTVSRMAMAMGTAFVGPASQSLIRKRLPGRMLGFAFGIFGTTMSAAAAFGPWIGGLIVNDWHWRWIFAVNVPFALLSALLVFLAVVRLTPAAETHSGTLRSFDYGGVLLLAGAVLSMQVALSLDEMNLLFALIGITLAAALYRHEHRHANPIIPPLLFEDRRFSSCCAITALNNLTMYSVLFQTPILLTGAWNEEPLTAGTMLLAMTLAMMASGFVAGFLINRLGPRSTLLVAQIITGAGVAGIYLATEEDSMALLVQSLASLGAGVGLTMPVVQSVALAGLSRDFSGVASGTLNTSRYLGGALGIALMTRMLSSDTVTLNQHHQVLGFYGLAVLLVLGLCIFVPRRLEVAD